MLRIIHVGYSQPFSFPVDPSSEFMPGQAGQLRAIGNNTVCGVSDGIAPIGIIDDIKTNAFTSVSINEVVIAGPIAGISGPGGKLVTPVDVKSELNNAGIDPDTFISDPVDIELIPKNGVVVFLAGTELNLDADGDGIPDSIRTVVSYTYFVPNVPGDDSTAGSGRVTIWMQRFIGQTDQFDTSQRYPLNANLFINEQGKFTTRQPSENHPGIALVTGTPSGIDGMIEFLWR